MSTDLISSLAAPSKTPAAPSFEELGRQVSLGLAQLRQGLRPGGAKHDRQAAVRALRDLAPDLRATAEVLSQATLDPSLAVRLWAAEAIRKLLAETWCEPRATRTIFIPAASPDGGEG